MSSSVTPINHVFLDLDDTLVSGLAIYHKAMTAVGLREDAPSFVEAKKRVKELIPAHTPASHSRYLYFKAMLEIEGKYSHRRLHELAESYETKVAELMAAEWKSLHRDALMETILNMDIKLSIITNETVRMQLKKLILLDPQSRYFTWVTISEEVGAGKPNLKMFHTAINKSGAKIGEVLMVGDHVENDYMPAKQLGMRALVTSEFRSPPVDFTAPADVIQKLDDLPERLVF